MTPEATALAERLVALVGWERLSGTYTTQGTLYLFSNMEGGEVVGVFFDPPSATHCIAGHDRGETIDLDHPSNEGHLRVLAEEVCGQKAALMPISERWALVVVAPAEKATNGAIVPRTLGKGPTPGQAYAAAIVAHYEGERA